MTRESAIHYLVYPLVSVALFAPLLIWNYWPVHDGIDITGYQIGRDFINVWAGPQLALGGKLATLFDLKAYHAAISALFGQELPFHNWSYPLFTLPVFWPLAQLPYFTALAVWTVGLFAAYAAVTLSQIERTRRAVALFILALAPATLINAIGGQTGFLSASLFLGGILQLNRRPVLAGVLFGLLTFKPHLGLVLPFVLIALGAWRTIAAAVVTAGVLLGFSVALFGFDAWRHYVEVAGSHQNELLDSFYGFYTNMMVSVFADLRGLGVGYQAALAVQIAVAVPVVGLACWAVRRTADPCRRALVLACAMSLLTPYAFNYDLTSVTAALVWTLAGRLSFRTEWSPVYLLAFAAPTSAMLLGIAGFGTLPLVALFVLSVREAVRPPAESVASVPIPKFAIPCGTL
ncbi:MAG: hypothetical protein JWN71_3770 [Xanthobacteraceae bacterium]|jgi:hypothetical protein|nr:hypothetical protein [Xanthobacteraceae bacterium]